MYNSGIQRDNIAALCRPVMGTNLLGLGIVCQLTFRAGVSVILSGGSTVLLERGIITSHDVLLWTC